MCSRYQKVESPGNIGVDSELHKRTTELHKRTRGMHREEDKLYPAVFRTNRFYIGFLPRTQYMHGTGLRTKKFYIALLPSTQYMHGTGIRTNIGLLHSTQYCHG
jgi:hypothetical protein